MTNRALIGLFGVALVSSLAACSDDTGTTGGSGMETAATETGDTDETATETGTTVSTGDGDGDMTGDGDGDPATGDGDGDMTTTTTTGDGDGDMTGDGDGDMTGDGDGDMTGDGDGDMTGDGDGDGGGVCGDGIIDDNEVCDDGVNDGSYGGCNDDCQSLAAFCGDGEVNGPEECDDQNEDSADGCLGSCEVPGSCLEILEFDDQAADGDYIISPKPDTPWMTTCDMTTDGGGWTAITLPHTCNGDLDSTITAVEAAVTEGIDMNCRPFTQDTNGDHTYYWDIEFPPGFDALWLDANYVLQAFGLNGGNTSEIQANVFVQSTWDDAHEGTAHGDVSFGSADEPGPVTSFAAEGTDQECFDCQMAFPSPMTPFQLGANSSTLRIGWGEGGSQTEGWYPWFDGAIYIR